jgi:hypothetical protein
VSSGELYPAVGDSAVARCEARCVIERPCADVQKLYCESYLMRFMRECLEACHGPQPCEQGQATYTLAQVCDGEEQCRDGSDEFECPERPEDDGDAPTTCLSTGNAFAPYERCDGVWQCEDGTDEQGCPEQGKLFTCEKLVAGYVRKIPQSAVCNLHKECPDGSDESPARCAQLSCPKK